MNKIVLLFPGQGSQYVKMGKDLYDEFACAKQVFEEANDVLGFDLKALCFEGDQKELTKTENAQPAILTVSVAAYRAYMQEVGVKPICSAGHSLGEYSALTCSGVIEFCDAVKIVRQRGIFMQEAAMLGTGTMAAIIGLDRKVVEQECKKVSGGDQVAVISNYNSPNQYVISGHREAVENASKNLEAMGALVTPLKVSAPFHSPIMEGAAKKMKEKLLSYKYNNFQFPVISNVTAFPYGGLDKVVENLTTQIVEPVRWSESMEYVKSLRPDVTVEIGPKTVLNSLMKYNAPNIKCYSSDRSEDVDEMIKLFEERKADRSIPSLVTRAMAVAVSTRNRNWDNEEYQKGVSEPYKEIQEMQETIETSGAEPTLEQMKKALEMLKSVFTTKKTPTEEQVERFNQIFNETGTSHLFQDFEMPS